MKSPLLGTMKVFRVTSDVNNYQWLAPDVPDSKLLDLMTFDCSSKSAGWRPPAVSALDPLKKKGDFLYFDPGVLLASPRAAKRVRTYFEMAGELLPLFYDDQEYMLLNVLNCIDALDHKKSEWFKAGDGSPVSIKKYSFQINALGTSSIFKVPEVCRGSVLTWEVDRAPDREFKAYVETNKLEGLIFEELWDSEKDSRER